MNALQREELFHDRWSGSLDIDNIKVDEFFEACTAPENRLILSKLPEVKGKRLLELGSGAGEGAVYFAKKGADVVASDISEGMLNAARSLAQKHGVAIETRKCISESTGFADESFDIVYAASVLHHVDMDKTLNEAARILKKGGLFVSWDPLAHNPIINIYRRMASRVRTGDEHPLRVSDLAMFHRYFSRVDYEMTWFFTLMIFAKFYLIDRIHPNSERYWKKIIYEHSNLHRLYTTFEKLDNKVLNVLPFFKRYCWNVVVIAQR